MIVLPSSQLKVVCLLTFQKMCIVAEMKSTSEAPSHPLIPEDVYSKKGDHNDGYTVVGPSTDENVSGK